VAHGPKDSELFELKLYRWSPLGPVLTTILIGIFIYGLFLLNVWATDDFAAVAASPGGQSMLRVGLLLTLILCAALGVNKFDDRAGQADEEALRREFGITSPLRRESGRGMVWATAFGLLFGLAFLAFLIWTNMRGDVFAFAQSVGLWFIPMTPLLWVMLARGVYSSVIAGRHMAAIIRDELTIDLYRHHELALFGRIAMRRAFVWLIFVGIILLSIPEDGSAVFAWLTLSISIVIASFNAIITMQPIRHKIRAAKDTELRTLRERLAQARKEMATGGVGADVPALVALEERIEKISEWPLDLPTAARLPLYILIPVVTWAIGVYAEALLQRLM